jgi:hypothetical protein
MSDLIDTVRAFLSLPASALPSAVVDAREPDDMDDPWGGVRAVARGDLPINSAGQVVILSADRDEWRAGVRVRLPAYGRPGAVL